MPDDAPPTALSWVNEPAISEGKVVYRYRNRGEKDATFVGEIVSAFAESGANTSQSFSLDRLAAGAEQETHAPMPSDLPDGPIRIQIQIQSASGSDAYDGELVHELNGHIAGGTVHAAGDQGAAKGTLAVDAVDVRLDGEELVLHYRITGDAHLDAVSIFVTLLDPQGGSGWMNSFIAEVDREDIFRTSIPFADVMDSDEGWAIDAGITGADTKADVQAYTRVNLPLERVDGKVIAASGWSSMTEI